MFTGIIQEIGYVAKIEQKQGKKYFYITCKTLQHDLKIGESIACNGICLTVVKFSQQDIVVETMDQTQKTTTAKDWRINTSIHLEKALALSDRLNGHLVQGHIDTTTTLIKSYEVNNTLYLAFRLPQEYARWVVEHGSICIDGVSLTVAHLQQNVFEVALIKHTLQMTHLGKLVEENKVNIEFDIIGKYVARLMNNNEATEQNINEAWAIKNL